MFICDGKLFKLFFWIFDEYNMNKIYILKLQPGDQKLLYIS